MPRVSGNDIMIYAGETLPFSVTVTKSDGTPETDIAVAKFAYTDGETTISDDCAVEGSVVSYVLTSAQTALMSGLYRYEIRVKSSMGDVDSLLYGKIDVGTAVLTTI